METEKKPRPPFKVAGAATIKHLNVRKEGPEDEKVLALHQNEHDMVMTAEECRQCNAAIAKAEGKAEGTPT